MRRATSCRDKCSGLPPSKMSVPRPAMLVAMVTAPSLPAWATMLASSRCLLAFKMLCAMPLRFRPVDKTSDFSTDTVPTKTGWPLLWVCSMSSTMAMYFSLSVL